MIKLMVSDFIMCHNCLAISQTVQATIIHVHERADRQTHVYTHVHASYCARDSNENTPIHTPL